MVLPSTHKWWYTHAKPILNPSPMHYQWQLLMESRGGNQIITYMHQRLISPCHHQKLQKISHTLMPPLTMLLPPQTLYYCCIMFIAMYEGRLVCIMWSTTSEVYMKQQSTRGGYILVWCYPLYIVKVRRLMTSFTNCSKHNKWRRKRLPMLYTATNCVWSNDPRVFVIFSSWGERKERVGYASSHL